MKGESKKNVEYAVDIRNVSKAFTKWQLDGYTTLKDLFLSLWGIRKKELLSAKSRYALRNFTARVPKGTSLGVIGRNGAGKSTLLKLITGIYKPTSGTIKINGRISALIELGAGFHPDFTGRENIYLSGALHGLSRREIEKRFNDIVEFAELRDVIDEPVRMYSSGMYMRLGFSAAIHTDPDILIIDEVLSVGDAGFVQKCKEKLDEMKKLGKTLIVVSHDLAAVERWCNEVIWLEQGIEMDRGEPRRVIDEYRQWIEKRAEGEIYGAENREKTAVDEEESRHEGEDAASDRWGSREVEIMSADLINERGESVRLVHTHDSLMVKIYYCVHEPVEDVVFGVAFVRNDGLVVLGTNTHLDGVDISIRCGEEGYITYAIKSLDIMAGRYRLDVAVHREDGYPYDYWCGVLNFLVRSDNEYAGVYVPKGTWKIAHKDLGVEIMGDKG